MIRLNINLVLIRINNFHQSISYGNLKLGITTLVYSLNNLYQSKRYLLFLFVIMFYLL